MCTVTFYPKPNQNGFILTFNRDEMPARSTVEIVEDATRGLIYPKDALHGGTWLAISRRNGRFTCLLNGAFEKHERQPPYRKSRGLILLESFEHADMLDFCNHFDFSHIEPFTMITGQDNTFLEFRWDGVERHILHLDNKTPKIWSSSTLYNQAVRCQREKWFTDFLTNQKIGKPATDLWQFHQTQKAEQPENSILMHRPAGPCTVSMTQLHYSFHSQIIDFQYNELGTLDNSRHQLAYGKNLVSY
jgi:Transport and Golgi organisation 2